MGVILAVTMGATALPASAHLDTGRESWWGGAPAKAGGRCVQAVDQQQHGGGGGGTIGREVRTAMLPLSSSGSCGGIMDAGAYSIRHLGWVYWAWRGQPGTVCVKGGYNYNTAGQDELVYSDNINAWTAWCGQQGNWVTHDTQQEVISPTAGWVIGYLRPATAHPYPS